MSQDSAPRFTFTGWVTSLARDHARTLARVARREGLSAEDALDAVQEAFHSFLLLPQARALVDQPDDAHALLVVLVRNVARNMRRRHHRSVPHEGAEIVDALSSGEKSMDEVLSSVEEHVQLMGCVNRLGEVQRRVVTLRMLEEMSGEEVARELALTAGHVAVLLHRAKRALMDCVRV